MGNRKISDIDAVELFNKKYIPVILYSIMVVILHIRPAEISGDDLEVSTFLGEHFWDELLSPFEICKNWSSRVLINPMIHAMMHFDYRVWMVFDFIMMAVIFYMIKKLCVGKVTASKMYFMTFLILIFPFDIVVSVGWVVTTMTYIWTAAAAFFLFGMIQRSLKGEPIKWYMWVISIPLGLYASNKEELSVMMSVMFFTATVVAIKNKKQYGLSLAIGIISVCNIIFHFSSPGNQERYEFKSLDFAMDYTPVQKVLIGIWATLKQIFFQHDHVFFCMMIILVYVVWKKCHNKFSKVVSIIPLCLWCIGGFVDDIPHWLLIFIGVVAVLLVFVNIYFIYGFGDKAVMIWAMLVGGFSGRATVGFANHGWMAYERTYTYLYYAFIMIAIIAGCDIWNELNRKNKWLLLVSTCIMGAFGVFRAVVEIGVII